MGIYEKNKKDPEYFAKAISVLDQLIELPNISGLDKKDIYFKKIEYLKTQKNYADIIKLYDTIENEFKNDTTLYPMILLEKAKFYEIISRKKAIKIYNFLIKKYQGTPYGKKAFEAKRRLK